MAGQAYFAVLLALLPLTAAVLGAVALGQQLSAAEMGGIVLVVAAVALRKPAKEDAVAGVIDDIADPETPASGGDHRESTGTRQNRIQRRPPNRQYSITATARSDSDAG